MWPGALFTRSITYTLRAEPQDEAYDGLYRLAEADHSTGESFTYTYDTVGNRTAYTATITRTTVTTYSSDAGDSAISPRWMASSFCRRPR
jgi:YD repeat-containing protein